ncbi:hypothetical protein B0F90DRAFT_1734256 [Multifurca ochricompacta]|uniref:Uncharacterized protein n=1 Tax=Multifurca ochricompacta TaxID=376703 RepID=A0AAD4QJP8_9AGAM|nr:hypothetical protein B0F90DRAFT_1734256 [Multifurca ochricompacta]
MAGYLYTITRGMVSTDEEGETITHNPNPYSNPILGHSRPPRYSDAATSKYHTLRDFLENIS